MSTLRNLVLSSFKTLHRTRLKIFDGDLKALNAARQKINGEFKKNKQVSDEQAIKAMVQFSNDVEKELRTQVIQAKEVKSGIYEVRITEDTVKLDNTPFKENAVFEKASRPSCQNKSQQKANEDR